jgi:hypothetical protein
MILVAQLSQICLDTSIYISIPVAPTWSIRHPRNTSFHFRQLVGPLRRGISPTQGHREYIIIIIMALQPFVGHGPLFQFLDPIPSRWGHAVALLVEALCYKPEGRGFESR